MLLCPPGVYRAQSDTELLIEVTRDGGFARGRDVLDVGTGSGALALAAARCGAAGVTAVDLSLRSVLTTWLNSRLHGARVTVHRGDLFEPVAGRRFGLVVANPPYVPAASARLPRHAIERCWDAGPTGGRCSTGSARESRTSSPPAGTCCSCTPRSATST